jgi:CO dehydrogenase nickel-insertion accessory protein CooC1
MNLNNFQLVVEVVDVTETGFRVAEQEEEEGQNEYEKVGFIVDDADEDEEEKEEEARAGGEQRRDK